MTFCAICHISVLRPHPELNWFEKCPTCGYSCMNSTLSEKNKALAEKNPLIRHPDIEARAVIEAEQQSRYLRSLPSKATS